MVALPMSLTAVILESFEGKGKESLMDNYKKIYPKEKHLPVSINLCLDFIFTMLNATLCGSVLNLLIFPYL